MPEKAPPTLKTKKVKGRMELLKTMPYKGCQVYVRRIDKDIFLYDVVIEGQIYSDYFIITPDKGQKELTEGQVITAAGWTFAGACATVDEVLKLKQKKLLSNSIPSGTLKGAKAIKRAD